jgi:hypothetical protein
MTLFFLLLWKRLGLEDAYLSVGIVKEAVVNFVLDQQLATNKNTLKNLEGQWLQ